MRIGELEGRCGNCPIIDYCTEPFESPELCAIEELADMDAAEYKQMAESITQEEIDDKMSQYEEGSHGEGAWTDSYRGAIVDIVLEKCLSGAGIRRRKSEEKTKQNRSAAGI